jgi:hypothetical protein
MYSSSSRLRQSKLQLILQLVRNRTNCLKIYIIIGVNYLEAVNEHIDYIKAMENIVRIARINVQFDR